MTDDELRAVVREEAERMRIRSALVDETKPPPEPKKSFLRQFAEHPAGRLVVGFVLTGVLGQFLSWSYAERKEGEELRRASLSAIRDFSTVEQERRQRYIQLRASILFNAPVAEIRQRKAEYDDSYVTWSSAVQAQRLRFREFFGYTRRHYLEATLDNAFLPRLATLHTCAIEAVRHIEENDRSRALAALNECGDVGGDGAGALLRASQQCAYELTSTLTHFVMTDQDCSRESWRKVGAPIYAEMLRLCDPEPASAEDRASAASGVWPFGTWDSADPDRKASLQKRYDQRCVLDDPWYEDLI